MAQTEATGQCPACKTPNRYTEQLCNMCGQRLPWAAAPRVATPPPSPPPSPPVTPPAPAPRIAPAPPKQGTSGLRILSLLFIGCGVIGLVYFGLVFDTSVSVPSFDFMGSSIGGGRVNNLGLMQERSNGLMLSGGAFALGVVLGAMEAMRSE